MSAAARPADADAKRPSIVDLGAQVGEAGGPAAKLARWPTRVNTVSKVWGTLQLLEDWGGAAIAAPELRIHEGALRPGAGPIVVMRDAGGGRGPAPLRLLLVLTAKQRQRRLVSPRIQSIRDRARRHKLHAEHAHARR